MRNIIQSLLIAIAVCIDSFAIGISYGIKNINFSKKSLVIINLVTVALLAVSMLLGNLLQKVISNNLAAIVSFIVLVGLGSSTILEGYIKQLIRVRKEVSDNRLARIRLSKLGIVINVQIEANDGHKEIKEGINSKEALYLGMLLSLDSLGVGFGCAIGNINYLQVIILVFIFNLIAILSGIRLGNKIQAYDKDLKTFWISGGILIVLGISKLT